MGDSCGDQQGTLVGVGRGRGNYCRGHWGDKATRAGMAGIKTTRAGVGGSGQFTRTLDRDWGDSGGVHGTPGGGHGGQRDSGGGRDDSADFGRRSGQRRPKSRRSERLWWGSTGFRATEGSEGGGAARVKATQAGVRVTLVRVSRGQDNSGSGGGGGGGVGRGQGDSSRGQHRSEQLEGGSGRLK